jgi:hypothetical protein
VGAAAQKPPAAAAEPRVDVKRLMLGILYPAANVVFAAQDDITKLPAADDPSTSPNPLTSTYGGWDAVQNASLALLESSRWLNQPRRCSNGRAAPVKRPDWQAFVQLMRTASVKAYQAAQSKSQDAMVDVSGTVTKACDACHKVYRDRPGKSGKPDICAIPVG